MTYFSGFLSTTPQPLNETAAPSFNLPPSEWFGRILQPIKNHPALSALVALTGLVTLGLFYVIRTGRPPVSPNEGRSSVSPNEGRSSVSPNEGRSSVSPNEGRSSVSPNEGRSSVSPNEGRSSVSPNEGRSPVSPNEESLYSELKKIEENKFSQDLITTLLSTLADTIHRHKELTAKNKWNESRISDDNFSKISDTIKDYLEKYKKTAFCKNAFDRLAELTDEYHDLPPPPPYKLQNNTTSQEKEINQLQLEPLNVSKETSDTDLWKTLQFVTKEQLKSIYDFQRCLAMRDYNNLKNFKNVETAPFDHGVYTFGEIYCPEKTAIKISEHEYLHANKMGEGVSKRSFIAFQVPISAKDHLWQGVFQSEDKNPTIFDLTGDIEYYPTELTPTKKYDSFSVTLTEQNENIYTYQVTNKNGGSKEVKRFHYDKWPDHQAISCEALELLVENVKTHCPQSENLPWIHCKAGVGRTGTLITALILKEKIESKEINKDNLENSLVNILLKLREQRGFLQFVQTEAQLGLLREYANHLLSK